MDLVLQLLPFPYPIGVGFLLVGEDINAQIFNVEEQFMHCSISERDTQRTRLCTVMNFWSKARAVESVRRLSFGD